MVLKKKVKRQQPTDRNILGEAMEELYRSQEADGKKVIRHLKKCLTLCEKVKTDFNGDDEIPPSHIIKSTAHNLCGEHFMDIAMQEAGQLTMSGGDFDSAIGSFLESIKLFKNTSAVLSLAGLARDTNNLRDAIKYYRMCLDDVSFDNVDESWEWVDQFIRIPFQSGHRVAKYQLFLLSYLVPVSAHKDLNLLSPEELSSIAASFGIKYSISSEIWKLNTQSKQSLRKKAKPGTELNGIKMESLLLKPMLQSLCKVLSPENCYWNDTGYSGRGYFSWVYSPEKEPRILIEDIIKNVVIKNSGLPEGAVKCTEWWTHTRLPGRDIGHQLHFDTEEKTLEETGEIVHPLVSCVMYIAGTDTGGNTIVINQGTDQKDLENAHNAEAWMSHSEDGAVLYFPGNLLHGVLPSPISLDSNNSGSSNSTQRLTILVALWDRPQSAFAQRAGQTVGPQAELPNDCRWVKDMKEEYDSIVKPVEVLSGTSLPLTKITRAWDVRPSSERNDSIPKQIDQRFFTEDLNFRQVLLDDHLNCDEEDEEFEEDDESSE